MESIKNRAGARRNLRQEKKEAEIRRREGLREGAEKVGITGKKKARTSQAYLLAMIERVRTEDAGAVMDEIMRRAKEGDRSAIEWFGKYVLGGGRISLADLQKPSPLARRKG